MSNQFSLTAQLVAISPMRYTPAGLPAVDLELEHKGEQQHATGQQTVHLRIKALALGTLAEQMGAKALGWNGHYTGFLAQRSAKTTANQATVFHIQHIQAI